MRDYGSVHQDSNGKDEVQDLECRQKTPSDIDGCLPSIVIEAAAVVWIVVSWSGTAQVWCPHGDGFSKICYRDDDPHQHCDRSNDRQDFLVGFVNVCSGIREAIAELSEGQDKKGICNELEEIPQCANENFRFVQLFDQVGISSIIVVAVIVVATAGWQASQGYDEPVLDYMNCEAPGGGQFPIQYLSQGEMGILQNLESHG